MRGLAATLDRPVSPRIGLCNADRCFAWVVGNEGDRVPGIVGPMAEGMKGIGFRIGVVLVGAVLGWTAVGVFRDVVLLPRLPVDLAQAIQAVVTGAVAVALILAACHVLDRRRLRTLGLSTLGPAARALAGGAGLWVLLAAAALLVGVLVGAFRVEFGPPSAVFAGWLLLQLVLVFCFEAFPEELVATGPGESHSTGPCCLPPSASRSRCCGCGPDRCGQASGFTSSTRRWSSSWPAPG